MNVVTRIITDDNISQLSSLSYSDTFKSSIRVDSTETLETSMKQYLEKLRISYLKDKKFDVTQHIGERVVSDEKDKEVDVEERLTDSSEYIVPSYEPVSPKFSVNEERSTDSSEYIVPNYENELPGLKIPSASYENSSNSPEYAPYSPAPIDFDYDPNATPLNIFGSSPNSPEYAPYSPAPIDFDYDPNATPLNIFGSSPNSPNANPKSPNYPTKIPSPHTPNYPPPILGGKQNKLKSDISKLSQEEQNKLLESLKKKRDELNKRGGGKNTQPPSIFDADDINDDSVKEGSENQEGGTRKITI
jgi:hypothetical protein